MDQIDSFNLNTAGDFYERTVAEKDLVLSFDPNTDGELVKPYANFDYLLLLRLVISESFNNFKILLISDILLSFTQAITSNGFKIDDSTGVRFANVGCIRALVILRFDCHVLRIQTTDRT